MVKDARLTFSFATNEWLRDTLASRGIELIPLSLPTSMDRRLGA